MSTTKKESYKNLRRELDELLAWFEQEEIDIDEAVTKYQAALGIQEKLETYLKDAQNTIQKLKQRHEM